MLFCIQIDHLCLDFCPMFRDLDLHFRQIEHLPFFMPDRFSPL